MENREITVIGAGVVGVCCALELQARGWSVSVVDPRPPGTATSFGNAGLIADAMILPYSTPDIWRQLPRMLLSPVSPMKLRWAYLRRAAPWMAKFLANATESRARALVAEIAPLAAHSAPAHRELMRDHRIDPALLRSNGTLKVYRNAPDIEANALEHEVLETHGIPFEVLNADELRQLEPGLSREFAAAEYFPSMGHVSESVQLTRAYARAFESLGGRFIRESVRGFELGPAGPVRLVTDLSIRPVGRLVLAAGAWSGGLAAALGAPVPLEAERGYHLSFEWSEAVGLNRPVLDTDHYYVLVPMTDGVRLTSGTELGGLELPPDFDPIRRLVPVARRSLPGLGDRLNREWMGYRPSLPDSKPIIGRSARYEHVYFGFGHGHLGLTQSAVTAKLLGQLISGERPAVDLGPYRAERFV